jgi:hypothetical protein
LEWASQTDCFLESLQVSNFSFQDPFYRGTDFLLLYYVPVSKLLHKLTEPNSWFIKSWLSQKSLSSSSLLSPSVFSSECLVCALSLVCMSLLTKLLQLLSHSFKSRCSVCPLIPSSFDSHSRTSGKECNPSFEASCSSSCHSMSWMYCERTFRDERPVVCIDRQESCSDSRLILWDESIIFTNHPSSQDSYSSVWHQRNSIWFSLRLPHSLNSLMIITIIIRSTRNVLCDTETWNCNVKEKIKPVNAASKSRFHFGKISWCTIDESNFYIDTRIKL